MIYVGFPHLTPTERCSGAPPLSPSLQWTSVAKAFDSAQLTTPPERIRAGSVLGRPVLHFHPADAAPIQSVFADSLTLLHPLPTSVASQIATEFYRHQATAPGNPLSPTIPIVSTATPLDMDQWTVSTPLNPYRPLCRVTFDDPHGTHLYVSLRTGEVVRDTTTWERRLNYVGAITHWIYPTFLRRHVVPWRTVGRIVSGIGLGLAMTGLIMAIQRRKTVLKSFKGLRRAHALAGALFGLPIITWLLSGFLSFRVIAWFDDGEPTSAQREILAGGSLDPKIFDRPLPELMQVLPADFIAREGEWVRVAGTPYFLVRDRNLKTILINASTSKPIATRVSFDPQELLQNASQLLPGSHLTHHRLLTEPDAYARRDSLPLLRVEFEDPQETWFQIQPDTGKIESRWTRRARLYRWMFDALHTLDFPWLESREWARVTLLWILLLGGGGVSALGVRLGWSRRRS